MTAYYNEIDPYAAQWLRNLIDAGHIAPGVVDERSIEDVKPSELLQYTQCHFFAGVGVWSYALRRAGWSDDKFVWTGSCPCQPFSAAGKRKWATDERHLWPAFFHLIEQCKPDTVFGEQVASKDGLGWLDLVQADLEGAGYAGGAVDLCAAGVGAPHIRQRIWFVAERLGISDGPGPQSGREGSKAARHGSATITTSGVNGVANTKSLRERTNEPRPDSREGEQLAGTEPGSDCCDYGTDDQECGNPGPTNAFWSDVDWLFCRDGKWRPVEPGTSPLAHGAPSRVGRLRAYGNAVNAEAAKTFIRVYLDDSNT